MDRGDPARLGIGEDDRNAIGGSDGEEDVRPAGDHGVAFSEEDVPPLSRRFFEGKERGAVDLFQADHLRVRRAESLGEGAGGEIGIEGAGGQGAAREAGRETRSAEQRQP